jgi:pre-mRNA-splicing factor ATP-dependent RNA helicase DHX15/PRP43
MAKQLLSIPDGDHLTLLNVFNEYQDSTYRFDLCSPLLTENIVTDLNDSKWAWNNYISARPLVEAANVRAQLLRIMERLEINLVTESFKDPTKQYVGILKALVCGYFMQVAHKSEAGSYRTIKDYQVRPYMKHEYHSSDPYSIPALIQVVSLHPSCGLDTQPEWVVFNEFVLTTQPYIRTVSEIRPEWLLELAPNYYDLGLFTDGETKHALQRVLQRLSKKQTDKNVKAAASNKKRSKKKKATSGVGSGSVDNVDLTGLAL